MSSTLSTPMAPPPLPFGWTEHIGPSDQIYYYNAQTQESTYVRPLPPIIASLHAKKRKEKPLIKTPIPGTDWLRVVTTEGNTFYSHKVKKESVWTIPLEIRDALEAFELTEKTEHQVPADKTVDEEQLKEVERIVNEVREDVGKRKASVIEVIDESVAAKKARLEDAGEEQSSEEEDWQREAAAQLTAEAEEEKKRLQDERQREEAAERQSQIHQLSIPDRIDLSIEEAKALFKALLREKDINPLHPWDTCLPLFISDSRYVLLPSVSARREAFDEYCRDRARELRQIAAKKDREIVDPKSDYERLIKEEVTSTRTSWTDFRRDWRKDRRFYGWGRDNREREKIFKEHLKVLGEKKRAAARKAEADFFEILNEHAQISDISTWKEVKKAISSDPRYVAVGSSSLREELFNTFIKGKGSTLQTQKDGDIKEAGNDNQSQIEGQSDQQSRKERKERAVREREERVKTERSLLEAKIERSRMGINREEGEREFRSLLVDAIRDPQITWDAALPQLKTDPRFRNSPLPLDQQIHLFHGHINHLRSKYLTALHSLFETHATSLAVKFTELPLEELHETQPVIKLGFDIHGLEVEFGRWQRERSSNARKAFDDMMAENSFVDFWGRFGKIGGDSVDSALKVDNDDIGEEAGDDITKVDMKVLAKNVDLREMEKVLKNDKRYLMFDHMPEHRERWLREYLSNLSAPRLSVHLTGSS